MARLDMIGVIAADLKRSVEFYRRLGLEFPHDPTADDQGHVEAVFENGLRFAIDSVEAIREFDPGWTAPAGGHRMALAFLCVSPGDVDRLFAELVAAGAAPHKEPWDAFWGQRYAEVLDPDGNVVDLFAPLEE